MEQIYQDMSARLAGPAQMGCVIPEWGFIRVTDDKCSEMEGVWDLVHPIEWPVLSDDSPGS